VARDARQVVLKALRDPSEHVRITAVRALSNFGGEDMLLGLREVAAGDPAPEVQGYSIRKLAADAIESIQRRALSRGK